MTQYPQHDKLAALGGANNTVGEFIEWLGDNGFAICRRTTAADRIATRNADEPTPDDYVPAQRSIQWLIAEFFGIDADEFSREKDRMIEDFRQGRG